MTRHNYIHPTAIIHPLSTIGRGNFIGPFCVIGPDVMIGDDNRFEGSCYIGTPSQHREKFGPNPGARVKIGNRNVFREFVTVHCPLTKESITQIGNDNFLMAGVHIPHDATIEDKITMANNVLLGGHTHVMEGANIGLGAIVHQRQIIGAYSMLGMGSIVPKGKEVRPGFIYAGNPIRLINRNKIGLERGQINGAHLENFIRRFEILRKYVS